MATREIVDSTGDVFGVATYGTSTYGIINSRTFIPDGVKATSSLGEESITATQFDYTAVADNYERRRTVHVHRSTTSSDRTVKVA
jgi:hypothetical protein|tara:strand:- start:1252 stop:1506 length:255 start_codon:yes stop_codon:yes gene_type:complete